MNIITIPDTIPFTVPNGFGFFFLSFFASIWIHCKIERALKNHKCQSEWSAADFWFELAICMSNTTNGMLHIHIYHIRLAIFSHFGSFSLFSSSPVPSAFAFFLSLYFDLYLNCKCEKEIDLIAACCRRRCRFAVAIYIFHWNFLSAH